MRALAVPGLEDLEAFLLEEPRQGLAQDLFIFNDQDRLAHLGKRGSMGQR